jgi:hypothetical protein
VFLFLRWVDATASQLVDAGDAGLPAILVLEFLHIHALLERSCGLIVLVELARGLHHDRPHEFVVLVSEKVAVVDVAGVLDELILRHVEIRVGRSIDGVVVGLSPPDPHLADHLAGKIGDLFPPFFVLRDGSRIHRAAEVLEIQIVRETVQCNAVTSRRIVVVALSIIAGVILQSYVQPAHSLRITLVFGVGGVHGLAVMGASEIGVPYLPAPLPEGFIGLLLEGLSSIEVNFVERTRISCVFSFIGFICLIEGNKFERGFCDDLVVDEVDVDGVWRALHGVDEEPVLSGAYLGVVAAPALREAVVPVEDEVAVGPQGRPHPGYLDAHRAVLILLRHGRALLVYLGQIEEFGVIDSVELVGEFSESLAFSYGINQFKTSIDFVRNGQI